VEAGSLAVRTVNWVRFSLGELRTSSGSCEPSPEGVSALRAAIRGSAASAAWMALDGSPAAQPIIRFLLAAKRASGMRIFRPEGGKPAIVLDAVKMRPVNVEGADRTARRPTLTASARDGVGTPRSRRKNAGGAVKQKNKRDKDRGAVCQGARCD
jgi:hypothetical protein